MAESDSAELFLVGQTLGITAMIIANKLFTQLRSITGSCVEHKLRTAMSKMICQQKVTDDGSALGVNLMWTERNQVIKNNHVFLPTGEWVHRSSCSSRLGIAVTRNRVALGHMAARPDMK